MGSPQFSNASIRSFLSGLGSERAVPGGGAAAGLVLAQACALGEMVCRINSKRASERKTRTGTASAATALKLSQFKAALVRLMSLDAQGFLALTRFPKEERQTPRYEKALHRAAEAPMQMCRLAGEGIALTATQTAWTSRWLYSDLTEAAILFKAGFLSARLNVEANLGSCQDKDYVRKATMTLEAIQNRITLSKSRIEKARP